MCAELVLAESVESWMEELFPGDEVAARATVGMALRFYADGASVSESCSEVRQLVGSWSRHPSRPPSATRLLPVAS